MAGNEENYGLLWSDDVRTGFISGVTFKNKPVQYAVVDGMAVFEGCIVLGTAEEMEARTAAVHAGLDPTRPTRAVEGDVASGVFITGQQFRWPNTLMPYSIDANLPDKNRVTDAIAHWKAKTNVNFVLRTASNAGQYPNYVHFRPANGCWSHVGMQGGKQEIGLASGCTTGNTIHEIGHAFGLWHEQSREDRDQHVAIHWENIQSGTEHNFNQHITDGDDHGPYDYGSIMHYPSHAFSKNNQPTITTIPPGIPIGQRNGLSTGDINTIHAMYQTWHVNMVVKAAYATYHQQNAWAFISTLGWRKIKSGFSDGVTNMHDAFCEAVANGREVNVLVDGTFVFKVQLL